jgi:arsenate reductase (glutaredoxin)
MQLRPGLRTAGQADVTQASQQPSGGTTMSLVYPSITIYHNPACGTSRNTLELIRSNGVEPTIVEYLKTPPTQAQLVELVAAMGIAPRELLRQKGTPYDELHLDDPKWTDDELLDFVVAHPILMNRPIVVTPRGAALCRPPEKVLKLLPRN